MTTQQKRFVVGLILAHWFVAVANAQNARDTRTSVEKASDVQRAFDPSETTSLGLPSARISMTGTRENVVATATIGAVIGDSIFELKVSGPIGKEATETSLVSLSGLSKGASADFGYTRVAWNPVGNDQLQRQVCIDYLMSLGKSKPQAIEELDKRTFICSSPNIKDQGFLDRFHNAVDWKTPRFITARVKAGRDSFKFAEPPEYADQKVVHNSYALTGAAGVLTDSFGLLQAGFQYKDVYEAKASSSICTPLASSSSTRCRDIAVSAPSKKIRTLIQAEQRKLFNSNYGIGAHFDYDVKSGDWAFNVPVYLFRNKDKGFNGGVAAGFVSTQEAADASIGTSAKRTTSFVVNLFIGDIIGLIAR